MPFQKGKLNSNFKNKHTTDLKNCIDCNTIIKFSSKRCKLCHFKWAIGKHASRFKNGKPKCKICNKILSNYDAQYCSKHKGILLRKPKNYCIKCKKELKNRKSKYCKKCYLKIFIKKSTKHGLYCKNNKCINCKKYCSPTAKRCKSCNEHFNKLGIKNPQFIHGKSHLPYSKNFLKIRLLILKRDNYTCQLCNKYGKTVHHMDYNKQNDRKNNLIATCKKCNSKVNTNRDYWFAYFTYIMEN